MTLIRKLALGLFLACLSTSYSNSQTADPTTGNLINYGTAPTSTTSTWNNGVYVNQLCFYAGEPGNCGPNPSVRQGGYINFSYGTADLNQVVNINNALSSVGAGVQLSGFNYSFMAKNGNGWDDARQDYLAAYVKLYGSGGNLIANYDYSAVTNNKYNWTRFTFSETFATPYVASTLSTAQVGMVGRDNNFWAGNYGPEVFDVDFRLKYKVDPCATNPAYSSTCAGFSNIVNTNNLLDSTVGGASLNQAFAINTALQNAGIGATVHGFNYGFNWRVGTGFSGCTATNQDGSCSWYMNTPAYANASVSLTNSSNQIIEQKNYSFSGERTSGSVSDKYLLPSSMNQSMLGMGRITGSASGTGSSIEGAWATMIYTADPCTANPLYSSNCKGYASALAKQYAPATKPIADNNTPPMDTATGAPNDPTQPPPPPGSEPPPGSPPVLAGNQPPPGSEPPPGSQPPPPGPPPPGATQTASSNPAGPPPANQPPPQGGGQPRAGEVKTAVDSNKSSSSASSGSSPSLSSVLSMISNNQARIGNEAKAVVQAAEAQATQTATAAQQQAESVAASAVIQSMSSSSSGPGTTSSTVARTATQTQTSVFSLPTGVTATALSMEAIRPPTPAAVSTDTTPSTGMVSTAPAMAYQPSLPPAQTSTTVTLSEPTPVLSYQPSWSPPQTSSATTTVELPVTRSEVQSADNRPAVQIEPELAPQLEGIKIGSRSPLNDVLEQRSLLPSTSAQEQKSDAVNKNVQPNELAGRVDIATMATQPVGYQAYTFTLADVPFYAPREIYRNQRTVDNARAQRLLQGANDQLHQGLVNLQYK